MLDNTKTYHYYSVFIIYKNLVVIKLVGMQSKISNFMAELWESIEKISNLKTLETNIVKTDLNDIPNVHIPT